VKFKLHSNPSHHFNPQHPGFRARFPDRSCHPPIPDIPIRAPKPGGSGLNGSFYTPKPTESRHGVFLFRGSALSVPFVARGFKRHHINQQPTASRARFPDQPCLPPIPDIPVRAPKPGGSRLNGSFHAPKPPESRHGVFLFRGSPLSVPFVVRGFRHHINQQPTASRARFS
jgi:hypothetical protein